MLLLLLLSLIDTPVSYSIFFSNFEMLPLIRRAVRSQRKVSCFVTTRFPRPWSSSFSSSSTVSTGADTPEHVKRPGTTTMASPKKERRRLDPMAKRPNQKCDPYGQGGKPLGIDQAQSLKATVHTDWQLEMTNDDNDTPVALIRDFVISSTDGSGFVQATRLASTVAAVAQLQNHFPSILVDRRIVRKGEWQIYTRIRCHTTVLGGLSTHDFHLAMVCIYHGFFYGVPSYKGKRSTNI